MLLALQFFVITLNTNGMEPGDDQNVIFKSKLHFEVTTLRHIIVSVSNSPKVGSVCTAENTGCLLSCHPLGYLNVEVGVQLLPLHPLQLVFGVEFLKFLQIEA